MGDADEDLPALGLGATLLVDRGLFSNALLGGIEPWVSGGGSSGCERCFEMPAAHCDVAVIAANLNLCAFFHAAAIGADAKVHGRFATAVTNRFQFDQAIRQGEQGSAAGKKLGLEICPEAVAKHGDVELISDLSDLLDLVAGEKLSFIDQDAGDGGRFGASSGRGVFGGDVRKNIIFGLERNRLRFESDPRFYATESGAGIDGRYEQKRAHPALMVIVTRLK